MHTSRAAALLSLGLLAALTGCATDSIRQSTRLEPAHRTIPMALLAPNLQAPVPVKTVQPTYPYEFRRNGITGLVHVVCLVDEIGRVQDATVESTTHDMFNQPAVDALRKWTFQPGRRDGQPVPMRVNIPVQFTME